VEAAFHLTANISYPLILLLAFLLFPSHEIRQRHGMMGLAWLDLFFLLAGLGSLALFYGAASGRRGLRALPGIIALGTGISVSNTVAVLRGALKTGGTFRRTPKKGRGRRPAYRQPPSLLSVAEIAIGLYLAAAAAACAVLGFWPALPFHILFAWGFLQVGILSALPHLRRERRAPRSRKIPAPAFPGGVATRLLPPSVRKRPAA